MAYTDSGLGWYANSDWMTDQTGNIGNITGASPSDRPWELPVGTPSISDGVRWIYARMPGGWQYAEYATVMASVSGVFVYGRQAGQDSQFWMLSNEPFVCSEWSGYDGQINQYISQEHTSGVYYAAHLATNTYISGGNYVLIANSLDSAINMFKNITTIATFAKSTTGYSVTCMCKWKTELGGDVYCSPILISSIENNTLYTRNSATPSVPATQHTFQGMTFYMRKAPLDIMDGSETVTSDFPVLDYSSSPPVTNDVLFALIVSASELGVGPLPEDDPYYGGGESGPDAGDPTFDFTSEDIPVPSLPSIGAYNTGFINMYKPTTGDLQSLAHYLWSGSFDPANLRKLVANPMDVILGLHIVPATASHPAASAATLYVGNIDTQLSMQRLTEQYYELDCGTINIEPKWGAYLDYAPYSKLTLYLPYIGFVPISPDDCMGGSINVKYHVDVLSGACCVYVYCTSNRGEDSHVLYSYTGACACDCPVTEGQYTNAILGILNIAGSVAGAVAAGITGNAGGVTGGIENAANAALSMVKPDVSRSGSFGGSAGLMGIQYPYLVLTVPRMCTPGDQQKQEGYPSFVTKAMGQLAGYNQVQVKRLEGMSCTSNETEEILTLLEGGVIF